MVGNATNWRRGCGFVSDEIRRTRFISWDREALSLTHGLHFVCVLHRHKCKQLEKEKRWVSAALKWTPVQCPLLRGYQATPLDFNLVQASEACIRLQWTKNIIGRCDKKGKITFQNCAILIWNIVPKQPIPRLSWWRASKCPTRNLTFSIKERDSNTVITPAVHETCPALV